MTQPDGSGKRRTDPESVVKSKLTLKYKEDETRRAAKKKTKTGTQSSTMSKLSPSLKALINAPFARPGQTPAPRHIRDIYARIAREASERRYGYRPWVALSVSIPPLHPLIPPPL
jgi:hypothetical protein